MKKLKLLVYMSAATVFLICLYVFLLGNEVFKGNFSNDGFAWYFLAKGIFCSVALCLLYLILDKPVK
ncbi:MAG: hypothetical protein PHO00_06655 [bacterium]|nr:hypothetical protein [bacterium]